MKKFYKPIVIVVVFLLIGVFITEKNSSESTVTPNTDEVVGVEVQGTEVIEHNSGLLKTPTYYSQLSCILDTGKECDFSSCEFNCGDYEPYKGWVEYGDLATEKVNVLAVGTVSNLDHSQLEVDGDLTFTFTTNDKYSVQIRVPTGAWGNCSRTTEIPDLFEGDKIEVFGTFEDGNITICDKDTYIEKTNF